jgi:hypothetical protein
MNFFEIIPSGYVKITFYETIMIDGFVKSPFCSLRARFGRTEDV